MNTLEILKAARALIEDPERWCQGVEAVNAAGDPVAAVTEGACRWCAVGALGRTAPQGGLGLLDAFRGHLRALGYSGDCFNDLVLLNDNVGHDAVLAAFDAAITRVEALT